MSIFSLGFFGAFAVAGIVTMTDAYERGDVDEASRQGVLAGPAIVEEGVATLLLNPGDRAKVLASGVIVVAIE